MLPFSRHKDSSEARPVDCKISHFLPRAEERTDMQAMVRTECLLALSHGMVCVPQAAGLPLFLSIRSLFAEVQRVTRGAPQIPEQLY